jgi:hypothetical protein
LRLALVEAQSTFLEAVTAYLQPGHVASETVDNGRAPWFVESQNLEKVERSVLAVQQNVPNITRYLRNRHLARCGAGNRGQAEAIALVHAEKVYGEALLEQGLFFGLVIDSPAVRDMRLMHPAKSETMLPPLPPTIHAERRQIRQHLRYGRRQERKQNRIVTKDRRIV